MSDRASLLRRFGPLAPLVLLSLAALASRALPGPRADRATAVVRPLPPDELRGPAAELVASGLASILPPRPGVSAPALATAALRGGSELVAEAGGARNTVALRGGSEGGARPRLMVLGDSILFGGFGQSLDEKLRERSDVWLYGSCGASSMSFLRGVRSECGAVRFEPGRPHERVNGPAPTPKVDALLATVKPDAALLVLGTNFLCCASEAAPDVRALADRLVAAGVPCLWVGVPSFRTPPSRALTRHYAMLQEAIGDRCSVLDARTLGIDFRDVGDRVHVEPESGQQWADAVVGVTFGQLLKTPGAAPAPAPLAGR